MDYSELLSFESDLAACYEAEYLLTVKCRDTSLRSDSSCASQVQWPFADQATETQRDHVAAMDVSPSGGSTVNHSLAEPAYIIRDRERSAFAASVPSGSRAFLELLNNWTPPTAVEADSYTTALAQMGANREDETQPLSPFERKRACVHGVSTAWMQGDVADSNSVAFSPCGGLAGTSAPLSVAKTTVFGPTCASSSLYPHPKRHKAETSISANLF